MTDIVYNLNRTQSIQKPLYENKLVKIEIEPFEIPWLKIFTKKLYREFSHCDSSTKKEIWRCLDIIETQMIEYFHPDKINIASFGNYVPHVHFHIQARFINDSYFPEPTWGDKKRDGNIYISEKHWEEFCNSLILKLN
ncbi:MAG: HIT family protein [Campylobacterota bacterium]|nr:HIT family protein [Campylobacterota bacterium]